MAKFGKTRSAFTPKLPPMLKSKGSRQMRLLPGRHALNQLTKGDPTQQSLGNYAKLTPSGAAGMNQPYSDIQNLADSIQPAIDDGEG